MHESQEQASGDTMMADVMYIQHSLFYLQDLLRFYEQSGIHESKNLNILNLVYRGYSQQQSFVKIEPIFA